MPEPGAMPLDLKVLIVLAVTVLVFQRVGYFTISFNGLRRYKTCRLAIA